MLVKLTVRSVPGSGPAPEIPTRVQTLLDAAATDASVELFAAHRVTITQVPATDAHAPVANLAALGIARFTAPTLTGTAVVGVSSSTLRRSNGGATSDRDWVAELANQFVGRFKLKLLRAGFELWSMTPVTVSGRLLATAVSQPQFAAIEFQDSRGGSLGVWIEIEINGPLKITAPPAAGEIPSEGDVILF